MFVNTSEKYDEYPTLTDDLKVAEQANWFPLVAGAATALGSVLSSASKGSAEGRLEEAKLNLQRDAQAAQNYKTELDRQLTQPKGLANQSVLADLLMNYKGNAGSFLNAKTREELDAARAAGPAWKMDDTSKSALEEMRRQAMFNLLNPTKAPTITATPKASKWEKAAGLGGILASAFGSLPVGGNKGSLPGNNINVNDKNFRP